MNPSARGWVVAALPLAAVLAVDPAGLSPFGPLKWALVPALVFLAVALLPGRGRRLTLARASVRPWAALLAIAAVAAVLGADRLYAWTGTPERRFGVLAWVLCALAFAVGQQLDEDDARFVTASAAAACAGIGLWAVVESLGWEPIRLAGSGDRPVGTVGSSAFLGAVTALLVPGALGISLDLRWRRGARRAATVAFAAGAAALVLSGARAAWVGTALALVVAVVLRRSALRRHRPVRAAFAVAATAVVAFSVLSGAAGRAGDAVTESDGGLPGRLDEWRVAARVVARDPLTGAGPEGYRIAFARAVDDDYEQAHGRSPLPDRAHSAPLDVAATLGLPGLVAFAAVVAVAGRFVVRALRTGPSWVAGTAAGLVAYAAQSLFLFPVAELDPLAWLLAGVVVARCVRSEERRTLHRPRPVPVLAGAAAAVALVAGILDVAADRRARTTLAAVARDEPAGDPAAAARLRPDAVRYRLVAARAEVAGAAPGGWGRALAQVDRALDVSPRDPVARSEQGRLLLDRARLTGDEAHLRAARGALEDLARRDPRNAETLLRLGLARDLDGDLPAAEEAWLEAERLAPRSAAAPANLALAYARAGRWDDARDAARRALARQPSDARAREVLRTVDGT